MFLLLGLAFFIETTDARALAVFLMPLISHHGVPRSIKYELELKQILDSSTNGVVYVNFGADMDHCIPELTQRMLVRAFGMLKCPVLWRWDKKISSLPNNVKIGEWDLQADVLKHSNTRLFISQCDHKSIDEAIAAAVPILAVPLAADQWPNAEQLLRHTLGTVIDIERVKDEEFKNTIERTMRNASYSINMQRIRSMLFDAASAPVRAANAIEHLLRLTAGYIATPELQEQWSHYTETEPPFCL